jgi:hypothetical protein
VLDIIFNILGFALEALFTRNYRDPTADKKRNRERWANVSANGVRSFRATDPRGRGRGRGRGKGKGKRKGRGKGNSR